MDVLYPQCCGLDVHKMPAKRSFKARVLLLALIALLVLVSSTASQGRLPARSPKVTFGEITKIVDAVLGTHLRVVYEANELLYYVPGQSNPVVIPQKEEHDSFNAVMEGVLAGLGQHKWDELQRKVEPLLAELKLSLEQESEPHSSDMDRWAMMAVERAMSQPVPPRVKNSPGVSKLALAIRGIVALEMDKSTFDERGVPRMDLTGKRIALIDSSGKTLDIKTELLNTADPIPSLISKINGNGWLYARPPHALADFSEKLKQTPFDPKNVKVGLLVIDSNTDGEVKKSPAVRAARLQGDAEALRSVEDLRKLIQSARGNAFEQFGNWVSGDKNVLVLIGHVEGQDYVVRTAARVEQFRVPISEVRKMAFDAGVSLIDLGCKTVEGIQGDLGIAVTTTYHPEKTVRSLETALIHSQTYKDFLVNLSSEDLKMVIGPSFVENGQTVHRVSIYQRIWHEGKELWILVKEFFLTLLPVTSGK